MNKTFVLLLGIAFLCLFASVESKKKPHILFIIADDLGWRDVSYNGAEIPTPTIDHYANNGVKLNNYYVQPVCSPTRTALMTGKYPMRTGMNHLVVLPNARVGAPLEEKFLPVWLKDKGYSTHAIGKWHLGNWANEYTPTYRGFDSFLGYYAGEEDFYNQQVCTPTALGGGCYPGQSPCKPVYCGRDFQDNYGSVVAPSNLTGYNAFHFVDRAKSIIENHDPKDPLFLYFSPENAHTPLQAPQEYIDRCSHISNNTRKLYCALVLVLDEMVKNVTDAFKAKGIWDDTLFVFTTDNGGEIPQAQYQNLPLRWSYAVNYPYRQGKGTYFEGGVKGVAFVHGKGIDPAVRGTSYNGLMHVSDWYQTLVTGAAGINIQKRYRDQLDSVNLWDGISEGSPSPREEVLLNFDPLGTNGQNLFPLGFAPNGALRVGNLKLIVGPSNEMNIYGDPSIYYAFPPDEPNLPHPCPNGMTYNLDSHYHLYNISADPYECTDIAATQPQDAFALLKRFYQLTSESVYPNFPPVDAAADPALFGGLVRPWVNLNKRDYTGQRGHPSYQY